MLVSETTTLVAAIKKRDQAWGREARGRGKLPPITA
jgi:hypothetical protein